MPVRKRQSRLVKAFHAVRKIKPDAEFEVGFSDYLRRNFDISDIVRLYDEFALGDDDFRPMMRRIIWRAVARRMGQGVSVGAGVVFKHLNTFEVGDGVFIGSQAFIQGRHDGRCAIGSHAWIGPQSFLDARDLVIEEYVGIGPGVKILGSAHTGVPLGIPIIQTELEIRPVRIEAWADIGTNAVILPGVTLGKGCIVGAGAVVTEDAASFAIVAGVPARFLRWRHGHKPGKKE